METPTERNRRIYEEATAQDEPVFVIRAKDLTSISAIMLYRELHAMNTSPGFNDALTDLIGDFREWQQAHTDQMKVPDLRTDKGR